MRQRLAERNVEKLRKLTRLPIAHVWVRGGTGHRRDLCLEDGSVVCMWPDGSLTASAWGWSAPVNS
jgi:hypothetical protein